MIRRNAIVLLSALLVAMGHSLFALAVPIPLTLPGVEYQGPFAPDETTRFKLGTAASARSIELPPVSSAERVARDRKVQALLGDATSIHPQPMQVGIGREIPAASGTFDFATLPWQATTDGGLAAQITVRSPDAEALRVELRLSGAADGVTFTFGGSASYSETLGPYGWSQLETMSNWSPIVDGDTMTIEVALAPGLSPAGGSLSIPRLAHHDISLNPQSASALKATGPGASGSCNIDIACIASQIPVAATTAAASARINFVQGSSSFLCSGQLINSTDAQGNATQVPYFITANHCVSTSTVAGTIVFQWFYQATTCHGSTVSPSNRSTTGGAALLYTNADVDVTLLRPTVAPPAGVFLAGWDATPAMPGTQIFTIHHPSGDLTKWSAGTLSGYGHFCDFTNAAGTVCTQPQGSYIRVNWSQGTTEGGSSGSGIYTVDQNGAYRLRGVLHGGGAACETPNDPDFFSRFDLAYPGISTFLSGVSQPIAGPNAIEYYNVELDHYFLTAVAAETTSIEAGSAGAGWVRTGYSFPVGSGAGGQVPVCRFYGPGPNSHFYTADAAECAQVKKDPGWIFESNAFFTTLPGQSCPVNTIPIYRTYNNDFVDNNSNHRYTTSQYIYQWMQVQPSVPAIFLGRPESTSRWGGEGTVMCAPLAG